MFLFIRNGFLILCALLLTHTALAASDEFPPGFTDSVAFDPASGRPVQVISGGKTGGPTVVLIHGLGQQASRDWLPVLPQLAAEYQVLIFDLPGFGRSDRPDAVLSPKKYAELVHWLIAQHAQGPVDVIGHSLGGAIALRHSHDFPEQVRRLLLVDAAGILQTTVFARHLSRVPDQVEAPRLVRKLVEKGSRILNHVSGHLQDLSAERAGMLAALAGSDRARGLLYKDSSNINAALGLVNEDFSPLVRAVRVPVLILWGERDPVAPLRTGQALNALLPAATLTVLPNVGHVPMKEASGPTAAWMLAALQGPLPPARIDELRVSQGDAVCKDQKNHVYRGRWRTIRLEHCSNVRIEDASVEQLVAIRSSVTLFNVRIDSAATAVEAKGSHLTGTGVRITARRAFSLEATRLDMAALDASAPELGEDKEDSLVFMSLGSWCDGRDVWLLHDVWKPRKGTFDDEFRKAPGARCEKAAPGPS